MGILLGNLLTGVALDLARTVDLPALPWLGLTLIGVLCAWSVRALDAAGHLRPASVAVRV